MRRRRETSVETNETVEAAKRDAREALLFLSGELRGACNEFGDLEMHRRLAKLYAYHPALMNRANDPEEFARLVQFVGELAERLENWTEMVSPPRGGRQRAAEERLWEVSVGLQRATNNALEAVLHVVDMIFAG